MEPTGISDQLQGRAYGEGFWAQHWLRLRAHRPASERTARQSTRAAPPRSEPDGLLFSTSFFQSSSIRCPSTAGLPPAARRVVYAVHVCAHGLRSVTAAPLHHFTVALTGTGSHE